MSELGIYGKRWVEFMERCHPDLAQDLERKGTLYEVAQSIDDEAWEYRELLDAQYAKQNPRPQISFEKIVAWERTRAFYTDGAVMRERVLVPRTAA